MDWLIPTREALWARVVAGTLPHAVLLTGQPGLGKSKLAREFGFALLCEAPDERGTACGQCRSCVLFQSGSHPDFRFCTLELNKQGKLRTEIIVDQIRDLIDQVALTSSVGKRNVFLIDPADALNHSAANAFLKTLEEPSEDTLILLVASRPHRLPATVRSRCQQYSIQSPSRQQALAWMSNQSDADADALNQALDAAGGAPVLALQMIEEDRTGWWQDTRRTLEDVVADRADVSAVAAKWKDDVDLASRLDWWCRWLQGALWQQLGARQDDVTPLTVSTDLASLARYLDRLVRSRTLLDTTVSRDLMIEELLVGWRDLMRKGG
jgi:DNA polymerase-3 subunit delta'